MIYVLSYILVGLSLCLLFFDVIKELAHDIFLDEGLRFSLDFIMVSLCFIVILFWPILIIRFIIQKIKG